jgi:hypothetical protein
MGCTSLLVTSMELFLLLAVLLSPTNGCELMLFVFLLTLLGPMYSEPSVTSLLFYALVRG